MTLAGCSAPAARRANPLAGSSGSGSISVYAETSYDSTAAGRSDEGSAASPGPGGVVSERQDELGLRSGAPRCVALSPSGQAHPLHEGDARRVAGRAATPVDLLTSSARTPEGIGRRARPG